MDVPIFTNFMTWLCPVAEVPEELPRHREASEFRRSKVSELREALKTDPSLDEKLHAITAQLLNGVEPNHGR